MQRTCIARTSCLYWDSNLSFPVEWVKGETPIAGPIQFQAALYSIYLFVYHVTLWQCCRVNTIQETESYAPPRYLLNSHYKFVYIEVVINKNGEAVLF